MTTVETPEETMSVDVVVHEQPTTPTAILELLKSAVEHGVGVEALERLHSLHERVSDRAAAMEFAQALSRFQEKCPSITKTATANVTSTKTGVRFSYRYAELDHIATTIRPFLTPEGLSYSWDSEVKERGILVCTCTLRHVNGHKETATFAAPVESSAGMSEQQKYAAALSYARRQSLIQVLGLTTCDPDTDAANPEPITQQQSDDLRALIEEHKANMPKFLKWARVQRIEDILARDYDSAVNAIRSVAEKRRQGGAS